MRTFDIGKVVAATSQYSDEITGFYPEEWLANEKNIALINDNDDIALFEHQENLNGTVHGHYFFWSRGKHAVKAAKSFLQEIFTGPYNVEVIVGLTPIDHKGALWMNRKLGFEEFGLVETVQGDHMSVIMTKTQWELMQNE